MRAFLLLLLSLEIAAQSGSAGQWIAVVAPELRAAIEPLVERRKAEGWDVAVLPAPAGDLTESSAEISRLAEGAGEICLVLLGDGAGGNEGTRVPPGWGTQLRMKDKPSDRPWALLSGKSDRDIATGRLPARSPEEAATMIRKILAWPAVAESHGPFPEARLIVGHHAAPPPFEALADDLINGLTQRLIMRLPGPWRVRGLVHVNGSPWQGVSDDFPAASREMMTASAPLLAYLGHSGPAGAQSRSTRFFSGNEWRDLAGKAPQAGLFFSCGCNSCELADAPESYGFAAMRAPGGPAAVIGSQGLSYAAMGYLAMSGMVTALSSDPPPARLGTLWHGTQTGLAEGALDPAEFSMLDLADGSGGRVPLAAQRLEHLESWMLLGDPAMPLLVAPPAIRLKAESAPVAGEGLIVTGQLPEPLAGATVRLTFERHPGVPRTDLPEVATRGQGRLDQSRQRRQLSADVVLAAVDVLATGSSFRAILTLPAALPAAPWTIRAVVADQPRAGAGTLRVP